MPTTTATSRVGVIPNAVHSDDEVRRWFASHAAGARLVDVAKRRRPDGLQLWTFASNAGAQRFYERHGFVARERTDGSENEEGAPAIRYRWSGLRR